MAAGLAVTAVALVTAGPRETEGDRDGERTRGHPVTEPVRDVRRVGKPPAATTVSAPVRIADAATVRLLRPGDRVDVIAAGDSAAGDGDGRARVVAHGARVTKVPVAGSAETGAVVVLSVPRTTAARLAGAGVTSRLAVTLW